MATSIRANGPKTRLGRGVNVGKTGGLIDKKPDFIDLPATQKKSQKMTKNIVANPLLFVAITRYR
ncbi:hypothetical protein ACFPMF_00795 [Larkinella bovis]|uniref:Uncharacterized protein n=1 Tax=Larkinella bovis TaxID=683041 RepID=A0ABW0I5G0_9BACT